MPRYMIERHIPGAADLTPADLREIAVRSNAAIAAVGHRYEWIASYVAGDKFYCIHDADSAEVVRAHARIGKFPAESVSEIVAIIGPATANDPVAAAA